MDFLFLYTLGVEGGEGKRREGGRKEKREAREGRKELRRRREPRCCSRGETSICACSPSRSKDFGRSIAATEAGNEGEGPERRG